MKRRIWKLFIVVIVLSAFLVTGLTGFAGAEVSTKTFKFRLQHWQSQANASYQLFISDKGFPKMVEKASGGRIKIEVYPGGSIISPLDNMRSTGKGVVDMAAGCGAYQAGLGSYFSLLYGIPFVLDNMDDLEIVWQNMGLYDYAKTLYAKYNTHLLGWNADAPIGLFSKKEIKSLNDLKGMKIRAVGAYGDFYKMFGASPMTTPTAEIYMALDRGLVDGVTWGSEAAMKEFGLHEVSKYILVPWIAGATANDMMINMDKWKALPPDLQEIMTTCYQKYSATLGAFYKYRNYVDRAEIVSKYGMKLCWMSEEDIAKGKEMALKLMDNYAKMNPESAKIVKIYKDFMAYKAKIKQ